MNPIHRQENSRWIKEKSQELGFSFCGISEARFLEEEAPLLEAWLNQGHHGAMGYMANHFDKRLDPRLLVPGAKSVVSLLYNYHNPEKTSDSDSPKIASYAYGRDYHKVIKKLLLQLMEMLEERIGKVEGRAFVDSAPVMERQWAALAGLGWTGKNTLLITKQQGSWFFLAELILDVDLEADGPIKDYCGTCTACIDACPTEAIQPYKVEAEKCISYLTIELKDEIPQAFQGKMENWVFGCDVCQEVCPWNRFAKPHGEAAFYPKENFLHWTKNEWLGLDETRFEKAFAGTPVKRAGYKKLMNSIKFLPEG